MFLLTKTMADKYSMKSSPQKILQLAAGYEKRKYHFNYVPNDL